MGSAVDSGQEEKREERKRKGAVRLYVGGWHKVRQGHVGETGVPTGDS